MGNYNEARKLNQYCFDKSTELNYELGIANSTFCLGTIGIEEGRIQYAIDQFEAVSRKHFEFNRAIHEGSSKILAHRLAGNAEQAYTLSVEALDQFKNLLEISINLRYLYLQCILAALEFGDRNRAEMIYDELKTKSNHSGSKDLIAVTKLSEGILLKSRRNLRDSLRAQDLFIELLEHEDIMDHIVVTEATRHLCELLIQEYELYEDPEILLKIQELMGKLLIIAENQQLIRLRFEIGIIQSKLLLLQGKFEESRKLLENLLELTFEKKLNHFEQKIKHEIRLIEVNFEKWVDLVNNNQSLRSIIEESRIKNYLTMAKQYVGQSKEK